jgi:hypothetical protein
MKQKLIYLKLTKNKKQAITLLKTTPFLVKLFFKWFSLNKKKELAQPTYLRY